MLQSSQKLSQADQCSEEINFCHEGFQRYLKSELAEDELWKGDPTRDGGTDHELLRRLRELQPVEVLQLVVQPLQDDPSPACLAVVQVHVDLIVGKMFSHHLCKALHGKQPTKGDKEG